MKHGIFHLGSSGVVFTFCDKSWGSLLYTNATERIKDVTCSHCLQKIKYTKSKLGDEYFNKNYKAA